MSLVNLKSPVPMDKMEKAKVLPVPQAHFRSASDPENGSELFPKPESEEVNRNCVPVALSKSKQLIPRKQRMHCLFCYKSVPIRRYEIDSDNKVPSQSLGRNSVEKSAQIVFLLETLLGISKKDIRSYLTTSKGRSPDKWIVTCKTCQTMVKNARSIRDNIVRLEKRLSKCKIEAVEKIKSSLKITSKPFRKQCSACKGSKCDCFDGMMMTDKIRSSFGSGSPAVANNARKRKLKDSVVDFVPKKSSAMKPPSSNQQNVTASGSAINPFVIASLIKKEMGKSEALPSPFDVGVKVEIEETETETNDFASFSDVAEGEACFYKSENFSSEVENPDNNNRILRRRPNHDKEETRVDLEKIVFPWKRRPTEPLGGAYSCHLCPNPPLKEPMNIMQFVHHIIFHHENPRQCTQCNLFMPDDVDKLRDHWKRFHGGTSTCLEGDEISWFTKFDINSIDIYDCWVCNIRFSSWELRDHHVRVTHDIDNIEKIIDCTECASQFATVYELKLHQALRHPKLVGLSCPVCTEMFRKRNKPDVVDENTLGKHVSEAHPTVKIHNVRLCQICGFPFQTPWASSGGYGRYFHFKSFHGDLFQVSYSCTLCDQTFTNVFQHQIHVTEAHEGSKQKLPEAENLRIGSIIKTWPSLQIECGLCPKTFTAESKIEKHLKNAHCLKVVHKGGALTVSRPPKLFSIEVKRQSEAVGEPEEEEPKQYDPEEFVKKCEETRLAEKRKSEVYKYKCSYCPSITSMNLDELIVHLVFHWRHPYKCTECDWYLPQSQSLVDRHWECYHPARDRTNGKIIEVNHSPGNVWCCSLCTCTFKTDSERDVHEIQAHSLSFQFTESCKTCAKRFHGINDLRLHKAVEHPELAEVSCTFCDESFEEISIEGIPFRYTTRKEFNKHCNEKHPAVKHHFLEYCFVCGEVLTRPLLLRAHLINQHGVPNDKHFTCKICHLQQAHSRRDQHMYTTHLRLPPCEICGVGVRPQSIKQHKQRQHGIVEPGATVLKCTVDGCNYESLNSCYFNRHLLTHQADAPRKYSCRFCQKSFKTSSHCRGHEKIHSNAESKPYVCEVCGRAFPVRNYLYIHKRVNHYKTWNHHKKRKSNNATNQADSTPNFSTIDELPTLTD